MYFIHKLKIKTSRSQDYTLKSRRITHEHKNHKLSVHAPHFQTT